MLLLLLLSQALAAARGDQASLLRACSRDGTVRILDRRQLRTPCP